MMMSAATPEKRKTPTFHLKAWAIPASSALNFLYGLRSEYDRLPGPEGTLLASVVAHIPSVISQHSRGGCTWPRIRKTFWETISPRTPDWDRPSGRSLAAIPAKCCQLAQAHTWA